MHLVLNEEVHKWHDRPKESRSQVLPIFDCLWVWGAQHNAPNSPRQSSNQIADHEYIVPVVIIGTCNVCPSTASQRSKDPNTSDEFWRTASLSICKAVEHEHQHESRPGADCYEYLED